MCVCVRACVYVCTCALSLHPCLGTRPQADLLEGAGGGTNRWACTRSTGTPRRPLSVCMCMCACVSVDATVCVCVCVRARLRACVMRGCLFLCELAHQLILGRWVWVFECGCVSVGACVWVRVRARTDEGEERWRSLGSCGACVTPWLCGRTTRTTSWGRRDRVRDVQSSHSSGTECVAPQVGRSPRI